MLMIDLVPRAFRGPPFHFLREKSWRRVWLIRQKFACKFAAALLIPQKNPDYHVWGNDIYEDLMFRLQSSMYYRAYFRLKAWFLSRALICRKFC